MRSLISIEFPVPEMEPESAHVASAVSVPYLQCGDCNPAPPRQHSPIRRYSGYSATPWYVLIQFFVFPRVWPMSHCGSVLT